MGQIARIIFFPFVFLPIFFATPRAEEQPDREMLRLVELLEQMRETSTEQDPQNSQWEEKEKQK